MTNLNILFGCKLWSGFEDLSGREALRGVPVLTGVRQSPSENADYSQLLIDRVNTAGSTPSPTRGVETRLALLNSQLAHRKIVSPNPD